MFLAASNALLGITQLTQLGKGISVEATFLSSMFVLQKLLNGLFTLERCERFGRDHSRTDSFGPKEDSRFQVIVL